MRERIIEDETTNTIGHNGGPPLEPLRDDLLIGLAAIAEELGVSKRRAAYWHESHALPTFKMLGVVCARRSQLHAELRAQSWRQAPQPAPEPEAEAEAMPPASGQLRCRQCGSLFAQPVRGRPPVRCPVCREGGK
jgi:hypothetical protein